jgi:hypothetical protein
MIEEPTNAFRDIASDQNFLFILAGAFIWWGGLYLGILSPLFLSTGFVIVCFYATLTALKRPVAKAWPGLLLGGLLQIVGYSLAYIPLIGQIIYSIFGPLLIVAGGVLIIYFTIPLALLEGELPVIKQLQKLIESKMKKEEIEDIEAEEPVKKDEPVNDDVSTGDD